MKKLSTSAQRKIASFLTSPQVRPLEHKLSLYHFGGGTREAVMTELARFQNPDGGFGHGLESDLRLTGSSVIATTIAFQRFRELHVPSHDPLVVNACRYLRDTYDPVHVNWQIMPPNVDDAPHAPWWEYGGELSHSLSNPRAEILGYLYDYPDYFPAEMRQQVTESVVQYLLQCADVINHIDFPCWVRLYETEALPREIKAQMFDKLKQVAKRVVTRDPARWREYGLQPLGVVTTPTSAFALLFEDALGANLDFLIYQLTDAGCWNPNWSWGERSPQDWEQAKREWRGVLTVNNLWVLRAFGRCE